MQTSNTYELTGDEKALIITDVAGIKTLTPIDDLVKNRQSIQDSKDLNNKNFDAQLEEIDRQIAFVKDSSTPMVKEKVELQEVAVAQIVEQREGKEPKDDKEEVTPAPEEEINLEEETVKE